MPLAQPIQSKRPVRLAPACIHIENLRLRTYVGFNPEERTKQQDVVVNAEIHYHADAAMRSDRVEDALDYKAITKRMIEHVEQGRFNLLEKLAGDLLDLASENRLVSFVRVRVDKPHALRFADSVSVTLSAERPDAR